MSIETAIGIDVVVAAGGLGVVALAVLYALKSKMASCMSCRAKCFKVHSQKDMQMVDEAQQKIKLGMTPSTKERKALNKVAKTKMKNHQSLERNGKLTLVVPPISKIGNMANMTGGQVCDFRGQTQLKNKPPSRAPSAGSRRTVQSRRRDNDWRSESKEDLLLVTPKTAKK